MKIYFKKGYTIYKNGGDPVYVTLHSGPSMEVNTSRDDDSDTVASLCWIKTGGTLIFSNVTRKMSFGIDLNRSIPDLSKALKYFDLFIGEKDRKNLSKYRDNYAWAALDDADHAQRMAIYNDFWTEVKNAGSFIILLHRKFTRIKNYPSIMDIITFRYKGISEEVIKSIVSSLNEQYKDLLKELEKPYKESVILEQQRVIDNIIRIYGSLDLSKIEGSFLENITNDIKNIKQYADKEHKEKLDNDISKEGFLQATKNALKNAPPPLITIDSVFTGSKAHAPRQNLLRLNKVVLEIEVNKFLSSWNPNLAADIIIELINKIRSVERYKKLGFNQKKILEFIKSS